ncbi:MAG TPA: universal stress protein [Alphaproteobacteria bacterium]|nr:universal stress protein [Alphaproteobacteria bacterium]
MALKVILAAVTGQDTDNAALGIAAALAHRFNAHVDALHVKGDPRDAIPFLGEGASGVLIEQIMAAAERDSGTRSGKAKMTFDAWRATSGLIVAPRPGSEASATVAWREETGTEEECIARYGRVSDLIIVGRPPADDSGASIVVFETALFDTGKPVIVAPPGPLQSSIVGTPALIFWTGSAEAAHAVSSALPLLGAAEQVIVVASSPGGKPTETDSLLEYLAWHGVRAQMRDPLQITPTAGSELLAWTKREGAGLLVMGAYTQSRLRQLIYGSVTKHVLTRTTLPVLMAH